MAFTGSATILKISDKKFCITGLSLGIGDAGTIGLAQGSSEIKITAPEWNQYHTSGAHSGQVPLNKSVQVEIEYADAAAVTTEPIAVVKAGADPASFEATLTNRDAAASGALVIYLTFHG